MWSMEAEEALQCAARLAEERGKQETGPEHLLIAVLGKPTVGRELLLSAYPELQPAVEQAQRDARSVSRATSLSDLPFSSELQEILEFAQKSSTEMSHTFCGTEHVLISMAHYRDYRGFDVLRAGDVSEIRIRREVARQLGPSTDQHRDAVTVPRLVLEDFPPEVQHHRRVTWWMKPIVCMPDGHYQTFMRECPVHRMNPRSEQEYREMLVDFLLAVLIRPRMPDGKHFESRWDWQSLLEEDPEL